MKRRYNILAKQSSVILRMPTHIEEKAKHSLNSNAMKRLILYIKKLLSSIQHSNKNTKRKEIYFSLKANTALGIVSIKKQLLILTLPCYFFLITLAFLEKRQLPSFNLVFMKKPSIPMIA